MLLADVFFAFLSAQIKGCLSSEEGPYILYIVLCCFAWSSLNEQGQQAMHHVLRTECCLKDEHPQARLLPRMLKLTENLQRSLQNRSVLEVQLDFLTMAFANVVCLQLPFFGLMTRLFSPGLLLWSREKINEHVTVVDSSCHSCRSLAHQAKVAEMRPAQRGQVARRRDAEAVSS